MRLRDPTDEFDVICTNVDDFKVVAEDLDIWIEYADSIFLMREHDPQQYYLDNDYRDHGDQDMWTYVMIINAKD